MLCILLNVPLQTGFFHFNGFLNIGLQDRPHFMDLLNAGEPNLKGQLNIFRLLDKDPVGIFNNAPL